MRSDKNCNSEFILDSMKAGFSSFVPKSYALIMPIDYGDKIERTFNVMKIRPLNVSKCELYDMYNSTCNFSYTCGGTIMFAENSESEEAFMLRAATVGIMPEIKMIENDKGNNTDVIDIETGISLLELRKRAIAAKSKKGKN